MDCGNEYIKMCEKATEIQKPIDYGEETDWTKDFSPEPYVDLSGEYWVRRKGYSVWLPRQDQLQEMVGGLEKGFIDWPNWLDNTYGFNYRNKPNGHLHIFTTWEQLWLAFVMFELYHKKWHNGEWVKNS